MKTTQKNLSLLTLTWPLFIEIFLQMLMGNTDTLMLSHYSDKAVAAVGVSNQIFFIIIVMFGFVATGTAILVAQNLGAGKDKTAAEISVVSLGINLLFGLMLSVILCLFSTPILNLMDLPKDIMDEADSYLKIVGAFSFIQAMIMTAGAILRSNGFTRDAMYVTIGMNVLHLIGNYCLIFGPFGIPVLGVEGTAISTSFSRFIGFVVIMILLVKRIPAKLPFRLLFSMPRTHIKNLLRIGIPSAGEQLSYNGSQVVITFFISMMGANALTTKVYTQNLMMFIYLFAVAIAQGTQIMIGHLAGAKKFEEAYKRCLKSLRLAMLISLFCALLFSFFSKDLLGLFTSNKEIISTGATLIWMTVILEPGRTFNLVIINSLRATGDVKFPVYMGILSMWGVSVTLSYLLGIYFHMGLLGVWIAFATDEWLRGLFMLWRWKSKVWLKKGFISPSKTA